MSIDRRFHVVDSPSDGLCGSVTVKDSRTGATEQVHWSVGAKVSSQSEATKVAKRRLLCEENVDSIMADEVLDETLRVRHDPVELDNPDARW